MSVYMIEQSKVWSLLTMKKIERNINSYLMWRKIAVKGQMIGFSKITLSCKWQ